MTSPTPEPSQSTEALCEVCGHTRKFARATQEMCSNYGGRHVWPKPVTAAARPEPPVEGALEEARDDLRFLIEEGAAHRLLNVDMEAVDRMFERLIAAARSGHDGLRGGVARIAAERQRQVEAEGYSAEHDAEHTDYDLGNAAACYAMNEWGRSFCPTRDARAYDWTVLGMLWPWDDEDWKPVPGNRIHELEKAGALIAAEIDRLEARTLSPDPVEPGGA